MLAWSMVPVPLCKEHSEQLNRETLPVYNALKRLAVAEDLDRGDVKQS